MKETEDDTNKWKNILQIGRISTVKMTIQPKAIYSFNETPYQYTKNIFHRMRTNIFKFVVV